MNTDKECKYIITVSNESGNNMPIGIIDKSGDYTNAIVDRNDGVDMAVYPSLDTAVAAMMRATLDFDPLVYDGMRAVKLASSLANKRVRECLAYRYVTYVETDDSLDENDNMKFNL